MTPPEAPQDGKNASPGSQPPAVCVCLTTLTKRADFLAAARAHRQSARSMTVQMRNRARDPGDADPTAIRVGYTCSKKVGNAVARNRAKRRLREAARSVLPQWGRPGHDYVLIGRPVETAERPFDLLVDDLRQALNRLHRRPPA